MARKYWRPRPGQEWIVEDENGIFICNTEHRDEHAGVTEDSITAADDICFAHNALFENLQTAHDLPRLVNEWANEVFPARTWTGVIMKLFEELGEYIKNPRSSDEYADVIILLYDLGVMHGIKVEDAVSTKLAINKMRKWAFNPYSGTAQHVEDQDNPGDIS